ncbi:hypothetical protein [Flaviaesturariibacter terrae]
MKLIFSRNKDIPPFDDALRAALGALPADEAAAARDFAAFQSLQAEAEKKKRRRILFWWMLPVALLLLAGAGWLSVSSHGDKPAASAPVMQEPGKIVVHSGTPVAEPAMRETPGIAAATRQAAPSASLPPSKKGAVATNPSGLAQAPVTAAVTFADTAMVAPVAATQIPKPMRDSASRKKEQKQDTLSIIW